MIAKSGNDVKWEFPLAHLHFAYSFVNLNVGAPVKTGRV
jgi:hypothetical protein